MWLRVNKFLGFLFLIAIFGLSKILFGILYYWKPY